MRPSLSKLLTTRRLLVRETMLMPLLLKKIKRRPRLMNHQHLILLLREVKRSRKSELLMVRIHQINESIYMHVSRTKFGMVMQIHCK